MLCPSTIGFVIALPTFFLCVFTWHRFHVESTIAASLYTTWMTLVLNHFKDIIVSTQMMLPINLWSTYTMIAVGDALFKWMMPIRYNRLLESRRETRRRAKERWNKANGMDLEANGLGQIDENTPLTGRGFARDDNGAYVEPQIRVGVCRALYTQASDVESASSDHPNRNDPPTECP